MKSGSVLGGVLLLAGSCIGAGMLGMPVITGLGGFVPALVTLLFGWAFMTTTALLLLEVNLTVGHKLSLVSLSERTLGKSGRFLCWVLFVFLFYSLSIAYMAASGSILGTIAGDFGWSLPTWVGSLGFTVVFGIFLLVGTRSVDFLNRFLMAGLVVAYCALVFLGSFYVKPALLAHTEWKYAVAAIPVLIISFGFHNMIPSLAMYFEGDAKRLRRTVLIGSVIPLLIYVIWEAVLLGIIPLQGREGLLAALDQGAAVTQALRATVGKSWINVVGQAFALFAIITSFLAQSLSLVDFLADGLKIPKVRWGRVALVGLTLAPPFALAYIYPGIFIVALNMASGFSAVILFGIFPALMVWNLRYRQKTSMVPLMPTGRFLLCLVLVISVAIFALELAHELGFSLLPSTTEVQP